MRYHQAKRHTQQGLRGGGKRRAPRTFEDVRSKRPKFDERYDATLLKSSTNFDMDKFKEIYTKTHSEIILSKDGASASETTKEKQPVSYKGPSVRLTASFSSEPTELRK